VRPLTGQTRGQNGTLQPSRNTPRGPTCTSRSPQEPSAGTSSSPPPSYLPSPRSWASALSPSSTSAPSPASSSPSSSRSSPSASPPGGSAARNAPRHDRGHLQRDHPGRPRVPRLPLHPRPPAPDHRGPTPRGVARAVAAPRQPAAPITRVIPRYPPAPPFLEGALGHPAHPPRSTEPPA